MYNIRLVNKIKDVQIEICFQCLQYHVHTKEGRDRTVHVINPDNTQTTYNMGDYKGMYVMNDDGKTIDMIK